MNHMIPAKSNVSPQSTRNDCTVRAFSTFTGMGYGQAEKHLLPYRKIGKRCHKWFWFLKDNFLLCTYQRLSLARFLKEHSKGRYMVGTNSHVFAVINGTVYDSGPFKARAKISYYITAKWDKGTI